MRIAVTYDHGPGYRFAQVYSQFVETAQQRDTARNLAAFAIALTPPDDETSLTATELIEATGYAVYDGPWSRGND